MEAEVKAAADLVRERENSLKKLEREIKNAQRAMLDKDLPKLKAQVKMQAKYLSSIAYPYEDVRQTEAEKRLYEELTKKRYIPVCVICFNL